MSEKGRWIAACAIEWRLGLANRQMKYLYSYWFILYSVVMCILMAALAFLNDYIIFKISFYILSVAHFVMAMFLIYKKSYKDTT